MAFFFNQNVLRSSRIKIRWEPSNTISSPPAFFLVTTRALASSSFRYSRFWLLSKFWSSLVIVDLISVLWVHLGYSVRCFFFCDFISLLSTLEQLFRVQFLPWRSVLFQFLKNPKTSYIFGTTDFCFECFTSPGARCDHSLQFWTDEFWPAIFWSGKLGLDMTPRTCDMSKRLIYTKFINCFKYNLHNKKNCYLVR